MSNADLFMIDELRHIASLPNSFDTRVLLQIQENVACEVMTMYHDDFKKLFHTQQVNGTPTETANQERRDFFTQKLNQEYRNRAANTGGFSLPMYLESAENLYRLDIRRLLNQTQDCIAHGKVIAEMHMATSVREIRAADPGVNDLANTVARNVNQISDALEKLSRIRNNAADRATSELKTFMYQGFTAMQGDSFSSSMLNEIQVLADVQRALGPDDNGSSPRPGRH